MTDRSQWFRWYALGCIALVIAPMALMVYHTASDFDFGFYAEYPSVLLLDITILMLFGFLIWVAKAKWGRFSLPMRAHNSGPWTVYYSVEFALSVPLLCLFTLIVASALMAGMLDLASYLINGNALTRSSDRGFLLYLATVLLNAWFTLILYRWWRGFLQKYTGGEAKAEPPKTPPDDDMYLLPGLKREGGISGTGH